MRWLKTWRSVSPFSLLALSSRTELSSSTPDPTLRPTTYQPLNGFHKDKVQKRRASRAKLYFDRVRDERQKTD